MSTIVKCPKCKGKGKVHNWCGDIFTFGLGLLFELVDEDNMEDCPRCGGSGFLKFE